MADFSAILIPVHMKEHAALNMAGGRSCYLEQCHNMKLTISVVTQTLTAVPDALLAVLLRPLSIHHQ